MSDARELRFIAAHTEHLSKLVETEPPAEVVSTAMFVLLRIAKDAGFAPHHVSDLFRVMLEATYEAEPE